MTECHNSGIPYKYSSRQERMVRMRSSKYSTQRRRAAADAGRETKEWQRHRDTASARRTASVDIYGWYDEGVKSTYVVYCPVCVERYENGLIVASAVHHGRKDNLNGPTGHIRTVQGEDAYDRFKPEKKPED